jgi:hypothetical protein
MKKNAPTAKRLASGSKDTKNPNAITRKRMKQRQRFKPSRRGVSAQTRDAKRLREKKALAAAAVINKGPAAAVINKGPAAGGGWYSVFSNVYPR